MTLRSPGLAFRQALSKEKPLQIAGAINANHALLAQRAGFQAIYLSGGGVAAGSLGLPDLGISTLDDADRHSPHHRRLPAAAAGGCGQRFRRFGVQRRPHGAIGEQGRGGGAAYRRSGRRQALRPSPQ